METIIYQADNNFISITQLWSICLLKVQIEGFLSDLMKVVEKLSPSLLTSTDNNNYLLIFGYSPSTSKGGLY